MPDLPISILFLGSKPIGYQCLQHLISVRETLGLRITGVLTQPRAEFGGHDLAALAASAGIPVYRSEDELPECDILYSVQHHRILRQKHIDLASRIAVNLHMAPLPEYRGCNQFSFAILDGRKEFGATVHQIDARIDHGDILFEKRFPVPADCWVNDLYELTEAASLELFKESLRRIITGHYTLTPQQTLEATRGTSLHYRSEIAGIKAIDLSWPAEKIARHIRATSMPGFELPYTMVGEKKVYFSQSPQ